MRLIKRIKQALNNFNWVAREYTMTSIQRNYHRVRELPMTTKNAISYESFEIEMKRHDLKVMAALEKYGPYWRDFLKMRSFGTQTDLRHGS